MARPNRGSSWISTPNRADVHDLLRQVTGIRLDYADNETERTLQELQSVLWIGNGS